VDLLEFEAERARARTPDDVAEVSNYVRAMNHGLARLETLPVSLRLIREIQGVLLAGVRGAERSPGEFRTSQNWIGPPGCSLEEATFVPPPPGEMQHALGEFEEFLHDPAPMPILMKLGLAHAQFETIHPFLDGNGRVGRLLITFFLCERKVLRQPLLYLSIYLRRYRTEYYDRLQAVREAGDWEGWLKFFLRGVREVAREATGTAREIMSLREEHRTLVTGVFGRSAASASRVLEAIYRQPLVTVSLVSELTGLSYARANSIVDTFARQGILVEVTGRRRDRLFRFEPYLALFQETD
jgi:Fic family protein